MAEENEFEIAKKYFDVIESRMDIKKDDYIIGRYSVLPYYRELYNDILKCEAHLVNAPLQHQYAQDLQNWYVDLSSLTPKTWFRFCDVPRDHKGPFVLKGAINSRKELWRTHMFAENFEQARDIYFRLMDDTFIQHQGVYIREFEELINYGHNDINGCPIAKEFRIFIYNNKPIAKGFYWSCLLDSCPDASIVPDSIIQDAIDLVNDSCVFWILDVAQKKRENG